MRFGKFSCSKLLLAKFFISNIFSPFQVNKATMGHLGMLKAKLAKLKRELITPSSGGGGKGEGFDVAKTGDARIG